MTKSDSKLIISARFGELKLSGCVRHQDRIDPACTPSCYKIRQADGTALSMAQIWDVLNELSDNH